jgi:signal transduction histidine kinase
MKRKAPRSPNSSPPDLSLSVEQEERRRIASELFNSTSEKLATLRINLRAIERLLGPQTNNVKATMAECFRLAKECEHELSKSSDFLYPRILDEFGLADALRSHFAELRRSGIQVRLSVDSRLPKRLTKLLEFTLFRFVQLALVSLGSDFDRAMVRLKAITRQNDNQIVVRITGDAPNIPSATARTSHAMYAVLYGDKFSSIGKQIEQLGGELNLHSSQHQAVFTAVVPAKQLRLRL